MVEYFRGKVIERPVTYEDYLKYIAPNFRNFDGIPKLSTLLYDGKTVGQAIYEATAENYHDARIGYESLLCNYNAFAIQNIATELTAHFKRLRIFSEYGIKKAKIFVMSRHACQSCLKDHHNEICVNDWFGSFERGKFPYPHQMPSDDVFYWCGNAIVFVESPEIRSSGDPEFDAWVRAKLNQVT
jgi:hypothetical protein